MKTVKPFARQGHYTTVDHALHDFVMPAIAATSWKILSLIVRKTVGWNKDEDGISYSQLIKGTGIVSRTTIKKGLDELDALGAILIRSAGKWTANRYRLNPNFEIILPSTENVPDPSTENVPDPSTENVPTIERKKKKKTINQIDQDFAELFPDLVSEKAKRPKQEKPDLSKAGREASIINAIANGAEMQIGIEGAFYKHLRRSPNWNRSDYGDAMQKLKLYKQRGQTIEMFAKWWFENDWRGKEGQSPTVEQVLEMWPAAFHELATAAEKTEIEQPENGLLL